jgi:predicted nucleic acid-binding protein
MNALLDINVVLDVFLNREEFLPDSAAVLLANHEKRLVGHLSAATLPTVYYIVRRNADRERARAVVIECLNSFAIVAVGRSTAELACTFDGRDFEDNLQMAAAVEGRLDVIISRDPAGYPNSPLPVFLPGQAVAELAKRAESDG